jgi:hypothetical protein
MRDHVLVVVVIMSSNARVVVTHLSYRLPSNSAEGNARNHGVFLFRIDLMYRSILFCHQLVRRPIKSIPLCPTAPTLLHILQKLGIFSQPLNLLPTAFRIPPKE